MLNKTTRPERPAYTITWQVTAYDAKGEATPLHLETRYVSSSGNWRGVKQYPDGKLEEMFAEAGEGVFLKRGEQMHFLSNYSLPPARTVEGFLKSPDYLRTETVMGQTALVLKPANNQEGRFELFYAPILNSDIKTIHRGARTIVQEPISLIFGEPDAAQVKMPKGLPVDRTNYERLHGSPGVTS
ncbi:MAG TPA: hypothetical protein VD835_20290 [Pyrinomonadaceae bacterium]|nr:hypothetical protein [Pyrinomonadaceae bacterium]